MNKQEEEQKVFDMAKQDILFLKNLELIEHNDRPDFILKDKNDRKIGLEYFRTDIYRVQDKNSSYISGGHTILNNSKKELFQKYHPLAVNNTWNDESTEQAAGELFGHIEDSLNMQIHYKYEDFLDNIRVGIHGRLPKVKGHIQKSKNYPDREHYDLMGFLIEIPVPSFQYYFETVSSQQISRIKSLLHPLNLQEIGKILRRYNKGYSYQKINGLPITNEIWKEINTFENIDFIIIETYNANNPTEHYGQYFDKDTPKPRIYPAFSFGLTDISSISIQTKCKDDKVNAIFECQTNHSQYDVVMTKSTLKAERRKRNRKSRKYFDEAARKSKYR